MDIAHALVACGGDYDEPITLVMLKRRIDLDKAASCFYIMGFSAVNRSLKLKGMKLLACVIFEDGIFL